MRVSLEITMYALTDDFKPAVGSFLRRLNRYDDIEVITNGMSTQVFGEFDVVMKAYSESVKSSFEVGIPITFVSKLINSHLPPDRWDSSKWS